QSGAAPVLATPLARAGNTVRLTQVSQTQLVTQQNNAQRIRDVSQTRVQVERNLVKAGPASGKTLPLSASGRTVDPALTTRSTNTPKTNTTFSPAPGKTSAAAAASNAGVRVLDTRNLGAAQTKNPSVQLHTGSSTVGTPRPNTSAATPKLGSITSSSGA